MFSTIAARRTGASRRFWLSSTTLTSLLLPLWSAPTSAQQTASPDLTLPEVVVSQPRTPPRAMPRIARPTATTTPTRATTPAAAPAPAGTPGTVPAPGAAPAGNDPLVVSPTGIVTPERNIASSVTVITRAELERDQRRTVPDALSTVPGLNIVQTGGAGGLTSIFLRGTNSNHTKIFIDGIDVSDPSNPARVFDLGNLLTADIERIEVLRGPQSGLYGSDALGGVISIITKKGSGPARVTSTVEGGSFQNFNQAASLSGGDDRINYAFTAAHFRTGSTPVTPLELLPPGRTRINDIYENWTYSTKLGFSPIPEFTINWVGRHTNAKLLFTGEDFSFFPSVPAGAQSLQRVHQFYQRTEAVWSLFDGIFTNTFGYNYSEQSNWNKAPDPAAVEVNRGDRSRYDWRGVIQPIPGQVLMLGLQSEREALAVLPTPITDPQRATTTTKSGYAEMQTEFAQRLFFVANARFDDNDAFGPASTFRLAPAVIIPWIETKLKGTYGTAFKAPTLNQLYVSFPAFNFFANPNLLPEESKGYDYGFEQPFFNDRFRAGLTYFQNNITNLITANASFTSWTNIGTAKTSGYEAFASAVITPRLKVRADYTYTKAIDAILDLELLRRPRHKYSVNVAWTPIDNLVLSMTWLKVSGWIDGNRSFSIQRLDAPGYEVVNLAANYTVNQHVNVFTRIDNLFNEQYQNPTGFLRPGFGMFGGIRVSNF